MIFYAHLTLGCLGGDQDVLNGHSGGAEPGFQLDEYWVVVPARRRQWNLTRTEFC